MSSSTAKTKEKSSTMPKHVSLPDIPALCVNGEIGVLFTGDGELLTLPHKEIPSIIRNKAIMVCHTPYTKNRLGFEEFFTFDVLELFAFTHPTRFCVPTPAGLCKALGLEPPENFEDYPFALMDIARTLLQNLQNDPYSEQADPINIACTMGLKGKGWPWSSYVCTALGHDYDPKTEILSRRALNVWKHLPEWGEEPPEPPAAHEGVDAKEALDKLTELLSVGDKPSETRPGQEAYCQSVSAMFEPMAEDENPHIVLAEAETGVGKTLGYLAPASVWADKNEGAVWISTFTKNLQRQIDSELDRLYPHPVVKDAYVAVRKGRENYLCLLNLEDAAAGAGLSYNPRHAISAGIMARWVAATKDGDLSGSDFPGWLPGILGWANTVGLSDRRGECIYSACDHYRRCYIERSVRKATRSRLVIANHALVMINAAGSTSSNDMPTRYVFDEGHHLFSAADSAYAIHLTARESAELRRWIMGNEGARKGRSRGLKRRCEDLIEGDEKAVRALEDIMKQTTNYLCAANWSRRFKDKAPVGSCENFLMQVYRLVHARATAKNLEDPYSIEIPLFPLDNEILSTCTKLKKSLSKLLKPMDTLAKHMRERLAKDQGEMDSDTRKRMDALASSLERRGCLTLKNWIAMLETMEKEKTVESFVDWMEVERIDGKAVDVGIYRHYVDPMKPFATSMRPHVHGMTVTSATLQDSSNNEKLNWQAANERSGAHYLNPNPQQTSYPSPFNYEKSTKVIIINDVNKNDLEQVASAYQSMFTAANGGALGLFTAIQRLRAVYDKIALPLEKSGLTLYGQHIEQIDNGTLIDIFREERNACLLGTDAVRDGVDVPGDSLRLIVFDRVPWSRPTLLHKARRKAFGGRRYDEMLTRLKLKQAFGRLIRHEKDKGIFVILDSMLPSRLQTAFPKDTPILKIGLKEAVEEIKAFL
ncbi:MAG: ATP-dependent DNA helicase [Alphaproteobacteria bacterium]|nr:ATP-dependent DNA helicase [Alphaproteobacteria bacterium]